MDTRSRFIFLALVLSQAAHSLEEYTFRLYDVFGPAKIVSRLFSDNLATGFVIVNAALVGFGIWCYLARVRVGHTSSTGLAWVWIVVEFGNGVGHMILAWTQGGYFPGVVTAIPLLIISVSLGIRVGAELGT